MVRRSILFGVLAAALVAGRSVGALVASVDPGRGHPGDRVSLQTDSVSPPEAVASLVGTEVYFADPGVSVAAVCDTTQVHLLGPLSWIGSIAQLTFIVPALPPGSYTFRARTPSAGCWIIGSTDATLTFEVLPSQPSEPPWGMLLGIGFVGLLTLVVVGRRRRIR